MKARTMVAAAFAAALIPAAGVRAQAPALAGSWVAEVPTRVENINGEVRVMETTKVRYTFELKGDSVFGTSQRIGGEAKARKLEGVLANGVATLTAEPTEARVRTNDDERSVTMITEFVLRIEGDTLVGTQQSQSVDGGVTSEPRPFKAVREKA